MEYEDLLVEVARMRRTMEALGELVSKLAGGPNPGSGGINLAVGEPLRKLNTQGGTSHATKSATRVYSTEETTRQARLASDHSRYHNHDDREPELPGSLREPVERSSENDWDDPEDADAFYGPERSSGEPDVWPVRGYSD